MSKIKEILNINQDMLNVLHFLTVHHHAFRYYFYTSFESSKMKRKTKNKKQKKKIYESEEKWAQTNCLF